MKCLTIILLLICVNTLDQFVGAHPSTDHEHDHDHHHHHHHHHPRYPPTHMQLTSCAAKLDFLCLSRLNSVIETYNDNVVSIVNKLKSDINNRLEQFDSTKITTENTWIQTVSVATMDLIQQHAQKVLGAPSTATLNCILVVRQKVNSFFNVKLLQVQSCIRNSTVNLNTNRLITNLTETAALASNKICDCVSNITTCSSTGDKSAAKGCAEAAAANLNIASIQQQADSIYSQLDTAAVTATIEYNTCLTNLNINTDKGALSTEIGGC